MAEAPGSLWDGVASRTEDRIRGSGSNFRMLLTYFDCRNNQNLKIFIIHNIVLNSLLIYINNNTHYNLYINLYSPTSGSKSKSNNTKHKYSRSEMLTRVDIIMTIM